MSPKQVPEIKQLPIAEQMERLERWINGHRELFDLHRGHGLNHFGLLNPNRSVSPTADLKWFDKVVGDARVFRNALAVFHRDGCTAAAEILSGTLSGSSDRWERPIKTPFEDELPNELEPMVLLMFEPAKLFPIMRWYPDSFGQLGGLWDERNQNKPTEETNSIVCMLPSLKKYWEKMRGPDSPLYGEVFAAIGEDILGPFGGMQPWFDSRKYDSSVAAMYTDGTCTAGIASGSKYIYVHDAYNGVAFAYLLRNVRQSDVLAHIPRALQSKVATWQFEVYKKTWYGIPHHKIMLVPEAELPKWQGLYKSSLSKGVAAGYVAVYNPAKVFETMPDGQARNMKSTPMLDNR